MIAASRARAPRAAWCILAALAVVLAATTWTSANQLAGADQLTSHPADPTGSFRTGLTRAGLVSVTSIADAHLWVGLQSNSDKSTRFDMQVELLNNGTAVATGLQRCVGNLRDDPSQAQEVVVPWSSFPPPTLHVGDVLALRVSTRIGTATNGGKCKGSSHADGLRLYYDSAQQPSRFGATITPDPNADLYLHSDGAGCSGTTAPSLSQFAPTGSAAKCRVSGVASTGGGNRWAEIGTWNLAPQCDCANDFVPEVRNNPPAPAPEAVAVSELPLPPTAPSNTAGSCDAAVNPRGTGCIDLGNLAIQNGGWIDNHTITAVVTFSGAPTTGPSSIYTGQQLIEVETDGTTFANGDPWKCITCGLDPSHKQGVSSDTGYPQPYMDRTQNPPVPSVLWGSNIVQCSGYAFPDETSCTPTNTYIYPIWWQQTADGSGAAAPRVSTASILTASTSVGTSLSSTASARRADRFRSSNSASSATSGVCASIPPRRPARRLCLASSSTTSQGSSARTRPRSPSE